MLHRIALYTAIAGVPNLWYAYHQWYIWTFTVVRGVVLELEKYFSDKMFLIIQNFRTRNANLEIVSKQKKRS